MATVGTKTQIAMTAQANGRAGIVASAVTAVVATMTAAVAVDAASAAS